MSASYAQKPFEIVFPPQVPFSSTLRWARAHRLNTQQETPRTISYRIAGSARDEKELAAAAAFCEEHAAKLELD
jgi:hypothetical protein